MGRKWRKYTVGPYSLGRLNGEAVVTWREDGKRKRWRLDVFTEDEGRAAVDRWARRTLAIEARESKTVADIWEKYLADRKLDGKKTTTMEYHWKALRGRFGALSPDDIDAEVCRSYATKRIEFDGKSAGTAWTELTQLRTLLNWAVKRKVIKDTFYVWVPSKPDPKDRVLDRGEVERLLDACFAPHVRLFVILALTTAGRSEAILDLMWIKVDFVAGTIDLRCQDPKNPMMKESRKGRALVPMNDLARAALQEASKGAITQFVIEWDGDDVDCIRKGFMSALERAGLGWYEPAPTMRDPGAKRFKTDITPHTLRHTANTWMQEADITPEMRARYLGHKRVETNQQNYSHARARYLQPAAEVVNLKLVRSTKKPA